MVKKLFKFLNRRHNKNTTQKLVSGFTIIEILVATSIITISMFALMQTASKSIVLSDQALRKSQSSLLLEEGAEAVKSIRSNNWDTISELTPGTTYYLSFITSPANSWVLNTTASTIDSIFTRTVIINTVNRDANDNIVDSGGTLDVGIKKITVNVAWGSANTKSLSFYIANILN